MHVIPPQLVAEAKQNFKLLVYFGVQTSVVKFDRDSPETLSEYIKYKSNLVTTAKSLKALLLNKSKNINDLKVIRSELKKCFLIFDEIDELSDPFKSELNFPGEIKEPEMLVSRIQLFFKILSLYYFNTEIQYPFESNQPNYHITTPMTEKIYQLILSKKELDILSSVKKFKINSN